MLKASTQYLVEVDISPTNGSMIQVLEWQGTKLNVINLFTGREADKLYERLTNKNVEE